MTLVLVFCSAASLLCDLGYNSLKKKNAEDSFPLGTWPVRNGCMCT